MFSFHWVNGLDNNFVISWGHSKTRLFPTAVSTKLGQKKYLLPFLLRWVINPTILGDLSKK